MTVDEERMRRLFADAVPPLTAPADRMAAIATRVRKGRTLTVAAAGVAALGAVLVVGLTGILPGRPDTSAPVAAPPAVSARTAGCAASGAATADPAALDVVATRLRSQAGTRFADSFTGIEITDRVRVYRKPSPGFDRWVIQNFAAACVELVDAPYSDRELQGFVDRVEADRGYWQGRGIDLTTVSGAFDGTVTIGVVPGQAGRARERIPSRYPMPVRIQEQGGVPLLGGMPTS